MDDKQRTEHDSVWLTDDYYRGVMAERERCARIADSVAVHRRSTPYDTGHFQACRDIAIKIRGGE
jgi:hypothetical protein